MSPPTLTASNVVPLLPAAAHWPTGVQDVWSRLHGALGRAWEAWAQVADDALFKRSEGASQGEDVQAFFEAMRLLRKRRPSLEREFWATLRQGVEESFTASAVVPTPRPRQGEATLSLVENADLEEGLATHAMAERWRHAAMEHWNALAARWGKLVPQQTLTAPHDLPVGPEAIAGAFRQALDGVEAFGVPVRLVLIKLFERQVEEPLMGALVDINQALATQGILPQWVAQPPRLSRAPSALVASSTEDPGAPSSSAWRPGATPALDLLLIETLTQLRPWLAAQQRAVLEGVTGADPAQLGAALLERLPQTARRQEHRAAIDQVAKVFDFLLHDNTMPTRVQVVLGRLQLPYLRLAVLDPQGFAHPEHPARQLLDILANEGQHWTEAVDVQNDRFDALLATVQRLLEAGDEDLDIFVREHAQWRQRQKHDRVRQQRREQLAVQTQEGQERRQLAQLAAAKALTDRLEGVALPSEVHAILAHHWGAVMVLLWLRHGPQSSEYRRATFVLDQLRYAARCVPGPDSAAHTRLLAGVPSQMRQGLALTGLGEPAIEAMVGQITTYLGHRLGGLPLSPAPTVPATIALPVSPSTLPSLEAAPPPAPPSPPTALGPAEVAALASVQVGAWLEFRHQEQVHRAKLSWISPFSGRWLMVSVKGLKVADIAPDEMARQLVDGRASVLPVQTLVERALSPAQ